MTEVQIPFQERFREVLLNGTKTATSRTKMYGRPLDTFRAFEAQFELTAVDKLYLSTVTTTFWKEEGVGSPDNFKQIWNEIHPLKGWNPYQKVWFHQFRLVKK